MKGFFSIDSNHELLDVDLQLSQTFYSSPTLWKDNFNFWKIKHILNEQISFMEYQFKVNIKIKPVVISFKEVLAVTSSHNSLSVSHKCG